MSKVCCLYSCCPALCAHLAADQPPVGILHCYAAMNKVDRLYKWNSVPNSPIQDAFARQEEYVRKEFDDRFNQASCCFLRWDAHVPPCVDWRVLVRQVTAHRKHGGVGCPTLCSSCSGSPLIN